MCYCTGPGATGYPSNHDVEAIRSNNELLSTFCEKRNDAAVVMGNKHFITLVSVQYHIIT